MNVGGPAAMLTSLLAGLECDVQALVGDVGRGEGDFLALRAPSTPVIRVKALGPAVRPVDDVRALREVVRHVRRLQPDIVHTHTAKAGALGRAAATICGVRARVHTFHGHLLHGYFRPPVTRAVVTAERGLARITERIVTVGEGVRRELLGARIGRPEQYVVIAPGAAVPSPLPDRETARAALGLPADGPVVVYVVRLTAVKRPDLMVAVARELPEATFVVVGDGPLRPDTERAAPANVRFLGWRPDMENVYGAADAILLTSENEGMPLTLIEAALCGVPAVATDVGSTSEVVLDQRTGRTVPPTVPSLVEATRALVNDPDRRRAMGAAARERARAAFGVEKMVRAHDVLYESLMTGPPRRRRRR